MCATWSGDVRGSGDEFRTPGGHTYTCPERQGKCRDARLPFLTCGLFLLCHLQIGIFAHFQETIIPLNLKEHSFKAGPVTLNYVEGPETGPPLVLLHGGSARWQAVESIIPELAALLHDFDNVAAGYQMQQVLPAIRCPVLLLQTDPGRGGVMTDAEVAQALPLLAHPTHIKLDGISHVLHNEQPEPVLRTMVGFLEALPN